MKAVVYQGPFDVVTREVADPKIEKPTDAVITPDEAPQAYDQFDKRVEGWTKVLLHPVGA